MRIVIAAVGRLKQGPERELADRYALDGHQQTLERQAAVLTALATAAAG